MYPTCVYRNEPTKTTNKSCYGKRDFPTFFFSLPPVRLHRCLYLRLWLVFSVVLVAVSVVSGYYWYSALCTCIFADTNSRNLYSHKIHSNFMIWFYARTVPTRAYRHRQWSTGIHYAIPLTPHQWINFIIQVCLCMYVGWCIFRITYAHIYNFRGENGYLKAIRLLFGEMVGVHCTSSTPNEFKLLSRFCIEWNSCKYETYSRKHTSISIVA